MTLQDKCTSLELSKRLKELGVPQTSEFYHERSIISAFYEIVSSSVIEEDKRLNRLHMPEDMYCSAFISDELVRGLPKTIEKDGDIYTLTIDFSDNNCDVWYAGNQKDGQYLIHRTNHTNMVEALGLLVEYLIINGYLDPKELQI